MPVDVDNELDISMELWFYKVHAQRHGTNMHYVRYMAMILFQCCSLQNDSRAASFYI
jgi:hypothetical protein